MFWNWCNVSINGFIKISVEMREIMKEKVVKDLKSMTLKELNNLKVKDLTNKK